MDQPTLSLTRDLIVRDLELDNVPEELSEQELLDLLADVLAYYLEHRLEFLFTQLYRMDIDEARASAALAPGNSEPANVALARLVLERQQQRAASKLNNPQPPIEDDGLDWTF